MHNHKKTGFFEKHIEKLRARPVSYRQTFAFVVSFVFTLIVFAMWSISTLSHIASANNPTQAASASESLSVFSTIKEQFSEIIEKNPIKDDEEETQNMDTIYDDGQATNADENLVE